MVLTGAGVSRESGLHTFRDPDGIWATVRLEEVATPEAFARNPVRVHQFYNARRRQLLSGTVHPNEAHIALARLEREWKGRVLLVTQNIDDLHERAGSTAIHMHGELLKARCARCGEVVPCADDLNTGMKCASCGSEGTMRPQVVWFGEMPIHMDLIVDALARSDLFISIGTSGTVYPAAGFVEIAGRAGAHTVELNLEESLGASSFDEKIYGPASKIVKEYVDSLLTNQK